MERNMTDRQADLAGNFGHPALNHGKEYRAGFARGIEELDDVHLGIGIAIHWRVLTREGRLARCGFTLHGLRLVGFVLVCRSHDRDH